MTLVEIDGKLHREVTLRARYHFEGSEYDSSLTIALMKEKSLRLRNWPSAAEPERTVPTTCLSRCDITGAEVLSSLLAKSDVSGRVAIPEFVVTCANTGKRILRDEADVSDVTGDLVCSHLMKVSAASGKRAEPEHFDVCRFSNTEVLRDELAVSEISGERYRADERVCSSVSGKAGHRREFLICHETRLPLASGETEKCEITGHTVRIGVLERCEASGKNVLPIGLDR